MARFVILGVEEKCPLCLDPVDARRKVENPVFLVESDGPHQGAMCSRHIDAILRAELAKAKPAKKEEPKNGPPAAVPVPK